MLMESHVAHELRRFLSLDLGFIFFVSDQFKDYSQVMIFKIVQFV